MLVIPEDIDRLGYYDIMTKYTGKLSIMVHGKRPPRRVMRHPGGRQRRGGRALARRPRVYCHVLDRICGQVLNRLALSVETAGMFAFTNQSGTPLITFFEFLQVESVENSLSIMEATRLVGYALTDFVFSID